MTQRIQLIQTRAGQSEVVRYGESGALCLVLPGAGGGVRGYGGLCRWLASRGFEVVGVNPRGSGASTAPMTGLTLRDFANDVADAIDSLGGPALVVGHAGGNRVARMLASERPELVTAVVLLAAGGSVAGEPEAYAALAASGDAALSDTERRRHVEAANFAPGNRLPDGYPTPDRSGDTLRAFGAAIRNTPDDGWTTGGSAPMLIVQGKQDRLAPPANGHALKARVGERATLIDLDNAGHALFLEQPERICAAITDFVTVHGLA